MRKKIQKAPANSLCFSKLKLEPLAINKPVIRLGLSPRVPAHELLGHGQTKALESRYSNNTRIEPPYI